ncbi:hypothetical protein, partial [Bradyrhizobium sp. AZCC 2289]|uniref:hypothetical protein n=1 Tax=Bradyrhizobium sp. AZCC 2289 TaxID=3117026 RepID=UPI002FF388AF
SFDDPIALPDGRSLLTDIPHWQTATLTLIDCATSTTTHGHEGLQGRQVCAAVTIIWNVSGFERAPQEELTSSDKVVVLKGAPDVR